MEQIALFKPPYKYIIDTSDILNQKYTEYHNRNVYKSLWERIENLIEKQIIVTCSEIFDEVQDKPIRKWLYQHNCKVLEIDNEVQRNVIKIVTDNPKMIKFSGNKGTSSGDAFLVATAMKYELIIITEEKINADNKIPQICKKYGIESVNINGLCERENWIF